MSLVDVAIPLIAGIFMVACPQSFFKRPPLATDEDVVRKRDKVRKWGFVLLGVAALYFVLSLTQQR